MNPTFALEFLAAAAHESGGNVYPQPLLPASGVLLRPRPRLPATPLPEELVFRHGEIRIGQVLRGADGAGGGRGKLDLRGSIGDLDLWRPLLALSRGPAPREIDLDFRQEALATGELVQSVRSFVEKLLEENERWNVRSECMP